MKLFLDFDPCKECDSFIEDLTTEESLRADDFFRNEKSAQFMRHLTYNHPEVIQAITAEVKSQGRKPEFDLYK
ncbi:MAG: hypothetical protein VB736_00315 [Candidatus Nitrosopelagicus sp.]|jgi:hypothetical protein|tara:strand:+ start:392 stop:610 length:219 start_codon:yes stop_codon:yes gene_type:complete